MALANQRKELSQGAEQAENRLMMLLDQERQEAKAIRTKLTSDIEAMTQKSQSSREAVVALEANVRELTRANEKLESALVTQRKNCAKLEKDLKDQRARGAAQKE